MSSNLQIDANRKNSESSTGPITEEGKAASSRNSFRHGLSGSAIIMLPHESAADYITFANGIRAEHQPTTITEDALVDKMARSLWMSTRAVNLQSMLFAQSPVPNNQTLSLYMRYQSLHDRTFSKALAELQNLRKIARQTEIGFVSQTQKTQMHVARIRNINASSDTHERRTHRQITRAAAQSAAPAPISTTYQG